MAHLRSEATDKGYLTGWRAFCEYLHLPGSDGTLTISHEWTPLGFSASSPDASRSMHSDDLYFTGFLAFLAFNRGVSFATARKYLCGVRAVLQADGVNPPFSDMPVLCSFERAWKRREAINRSPVTAPKASLKHSQLLLVNPRNTNTWLWAYWFNR